MKAARGWHSFALILWMDRFFVFDELFMMLSFRADVGHL
jgi:hypothetical protein